jgi:hypothetical protein
MAQVFLSQIFSSSKQFLAITTNEFKQGMDRVERKGLKVNSATTIFEIRCFRI